MTAHDDQLCGFCVFDELSRRPIPHDKPVHRHVGIAFLPARQALGKAALRCLFRRRPVHLRKLARHRDVTPCVQRHQIDPATRRLVERDRGRELRRRRAVDPDQNGGVRLRPAFLMDDGDRAVRLPHHGGTDRTEHPPRQKSSSSGAHDDQLCLIGHLDQGQRRGREHQLPADGDLAVGRHRLFGDFYRVHDGLLAFVFQPHLQRLRVRNRWPGRGGGYHRVDHRQRKISHRRITGRPNHGGIRCGRAIDCDDDAMMINGCRHLVLPPSPSDAIGRCDRQS